MKRYASWLFVAFVLALLLTLGLGRIDLIDLRVCSSTRLSGERLA